MDQPTPTNYVDVGDVAAEFEIGERAVWLWIKQGKIRAVQPGGPGGKYRIPFTELERLRSGEPSSERSA